MVPNVRSWPTASASISTPHHVVPSSRLPRDDALLAVHGDGVPPAQRHRDVGGERPEGDHVVEARLGVLPLARLALHLASRRLRDAEGRHRRARSGGAHGGVGGEPAPDGHVGLVHGASSPGPARRGRCDQPATARHRGQRRPRPCGRTRRPATPCGRRGRDERAQTRLRGCSASAGRRVPLEHALDRAARSRSRPPRRSRRAAGASMTRPRRRAPTRASQRADQGQQQPAEQPADEQHAAGPARPRRRRVADHLVELGPADDDVERQPERARPRRRRASTSWASPDDAPPDRHPGEQRGADDGPVEGVAERGAGRVARRARRPPPTGAAAPAPARSASRRVARSTAGARGRASAAAATSGRARSARRRRRHRDVAAVEPQPAQRSGTQRAAPTG